MRRLVVLLLVLFALAAPASAQKRIAFSFDDVPRRPGAFMTSGQRTDRLIAALRRSGVRQAAFFLTPGHLEEPYGAGGEARIAAYVRAGHVIANHSWSHRWLSRIGAAAYLADLDRAAAWLAGRRGARPWFRYPYLDEGNRQGAEPGTRDAVRAGLTERGLANGYVTIDSYDWYLDDLANRARAAGRAMDMAALRDLYVEMVVDAAEFADALAVRTLGRRPIQVALMHETDLEAMFLPDAIAALRRRGWRVATMDQAYRDPIARVIPDARYLGGGRLAAIANAAGRPASELVPALNEEATILRLFNERVLREAAAQ
ncbi:MAG TPA: polysaccharide deacetylase family protein [Allosphingosinicella sp.]|jgi:peptidoglycan/xylan/chitin deacetylase (PgdA/CDA1 family)|nr:polysaccharide deacetylase family protein [Allosphingosinicella sp.]